MASHHTLNKIQDHYHVCKLYLVHSPLLCAFFLLLSSLPTALQVPWSSCCFNMPNVFLFQGRHMICFSFSPLSYIVFSHKFLLQSLTQKCNKTQSYIGTASSEIRAGVFQERKYAGCTGETQGKEFLHLALSSKYKMAQPKVITEREKKNSLQPSHPQAKWQVHHPNS